MGKLKHHKHANKVSYPGKLDNHNHANKVLWVSSTTTIMQSFTLMAVLAFKKKYIVKIYTTGWKT